MKKLLSVLFVLLMLCACGSTNNETETKLDMSKVTTVADLKGATVAIQSDLHETLADQIDGVTKKWFDSFDDEYYAVKSGTIDCAIMDESAAMGYCNNDDSIAYIPFKNNENGFVVAEADYANSAAFKKGNPLRDDVDAIISSIDMQVFVDTMEEVKAVYEGKTIEGFTLTCEEPETTNGVLVVGMECASPTFNWTDIDGASFGSVTIAHGLGEGEPCNGLDVQVAKYVANKLGKKLEVYALEWDSLLPALDAGTIDCVIGNMSPREDRKVNYDFTASYYNSDYVVVYKK